MKTLLTSILLLGLLSAPASASDRARRLLDILVAAYPDFLASHDGETLIWKDGTRMAFDDGAGAKAFEILLNRPDLEDQFYVPYPAGRAGVTPAVNTDPGRVRYEPFFKKMYGDCKKGAVRADLVEIVWLPKTWKKRIKVTRVNGVAARLQAVSDQLERLPAKFRKYLMPISGTYNCRVIAGTQRYSVHAFGAAIDINVKHADYWRWSKPDKTGRYRYRNRVPLEIVEVFERHGFIWGGKWYHYDTMHFEYRPELLKALPE